jgi:hypothetical protein
MDIFYYWKNFESDLAAGRIGWFISDHERLGQLNNENPGFIWAFRTPPGRKGELQVLARLECTKLRPRGGSIPPAVSTIYYDAHSRNSVRFCGSESDDAVRAVTSIFKRRPSFYAAFRANFQGVNGVWRLMSDVVRELENAVKQLRAQPFVGI